MRKPIGKNTGSPPTRPSNASSPKSAAASAHKVVVDTNVWLAGLYKRDVETDSYAVLQALKSRRLRLCMSTLISTELTRMVLEFATKKDDTMDQHMAQRGFQDLVWFLRNGFDHVEPKVELGACTAHAADNRFIDCAYEARAVVVSKNLHLLDLDERIQLPVELSSG